MSASPVPAGSAHLTPPRLEDLLLGACACALALGWWPNLLTSNPDPLLGLALVLLYVGEHYAFAQRSRRSVLHLRRALGPLVSDRELESSLAPPGYALLVGPVLRAAFRVVVLVRGLIGLGVPEGALESDAVAIGIALLMLFELGFAGYWCFQVTTLGAAPRSAPASPAVIAGAEGSRWKRLLERAVQHDSRRRDFAADLVVSLWSCAIFGSACQGFGADMARWSADSAGESPWFLGGSLLFATALLALVIFVPLHLDTWAEREREVRTRRAWWRSRLGAITAMGLGISPAYVSFARHVLGVG